VRERTSGLSAQIRVRAALRVLAPADAIHFARGFRVPLELVAGLTQCPRIGVILVWHRRCRVDQVAGVVVFVAQVAARAAVAHVQNHVEPHTGWHQRDKRSSHHVVADASGLVVIQRTNAGVGAAFFVAVIVALQRTVSRVMKPELVAGARALQQFLESRQDVRTSGFSRRHITEYDARI